jgi:two-component system, NarL family, nitrate/nitrite response regulator NarL
MQSCLICDDHVLVREALVGTVRMSWPSIEISEAGDFSSAWTKASAQPDFCIADLIMPGASPLVGIQGIMSAAPNTPILVVTGTEDDALLLGLLKSGVAGFAPKTASGSIIEAAIRLILAGGRYFPPRLADIAGSWIASSPRDEATLVRDTSLDNERDRREAGLLAQLTSRQIEVLKLVCAGQSNKEIARALGLAPSTVKTHMEHLMETLGVTNRTEATMRAHRLKLF